MPKFIDLTGQRFGRLTVIDRAPNRGPHVCWKCRCDCGRYSEPMAQTLRVGGAQSCGCIQREKAAAIGGRSRTHGRTGDPIYQTWANMIRRCEDPKNKSFAIYGGRGIRVCRRWRESFETFLADMGDKPSPAHSLERIRTSGDYTPENCTWATKTEQANNRRSNRLLTAAGQTATLAEWARMLGCNRSAIHYRIKRGLPFHTVRPRPR